MITMIDVAAGILLAYNLMGIGHNTWGYVIGYYIGNFIVNYFDL